jgi:2-polyprenyl-3-methyl-5-hydroxy-6-metoxy-1,4-benzoquinol methylase
LYRVPASPAQQQAEFYQKEYSQGFTTDLPSDERLRDLIQSGFVGTERDYSRYLTIFSALGIEKGSRLLEYGCSWGYGAWQLQNAGFRVTAFEISRPRCRFAREKLGVDAVVNSSEIKGPFDVTFSAHVLEHVDSVQSALDIQMGLLRPGGWLVGITPNGSQPYRKMHFANFHRLWGLVHPQLLDDEFLLNKFSGLDLRMGSIAGLDGIEESLVKGNQNLNLHRWELFFAVRKPI